MPRTPPWALSLCPRQPHLQEPVRPRTIKKQPSPHPYPHGIPGQVGALPESARSSPQSLPFAHTPSHPTSEAPWRAAWKAPNISLHGLFWDYRTLRTQGRGPCQSLCRKSGLRDGRPHARVSNSSHATFPTPPPQMPSSEPLPTLTDALSNHTQAAWGHRGHQGPDAPGSPLPHRGAQEDISQGSGCTCPQPGRIQPPQKQHSQPTCRVVPNLRPAVTPVRGPQ